MTKVSTITPCYNMGRYIKGFLENVSIQTHKDLEIILDHNDPTEAEVKSIKSKKRTFKDEIIDVEVDSDNK